MLRRLKATSLFLILLNLTTICGVIVVARENLRLRNITTPAILTIGERSYYAGCGSASGNLDYCKLLAAQYRRDMAEFLGE